MCALPYSVANHVALRTSTLVVDTEDSSLRTMGCFTHMNCTRDQDKCTKRVEHLDFPRHRRVDTLVAYALSLVDSYDNNLTC
ncbi:hypothetical protein GT037_009676 [Alternaria burnsii]|uniref:Uncharacterized protein n=1 Tax=Alternaria burnsii TaxID=1187904 RepID=A0A8H7AVP8_9PLEO|nr:uncharacterized protein GT037_009676 [Alternaria burnsii]KAF7672166.1 hypothetical protein GT037_009676 [Alternaria burnsii]